jgi:bifunctional UDP-N-acetylglucosamine pyrophosphorylase/glucosamine-1-phosphate N-acetyltransferase
MTTKLDDPTGYGRVIRESSGQVMRIVEQKDADEAEQAVDEINTGIMVVNTHRLIEWLGALSNDNAQGEYYLTDIVEMAVHEKRSVVAHCVADADCVTGVNDRKQQAEMEAYMRARRVETIMTEGCTVRDPLRVDIRGSLTVGRDVQIDVNTIFEGDVVLNDGVVIGAGSIIRNSVIGSNTVIEANSIIESSNVGTNATIGPFARLRPGTVLASDTKIGNFVETKNAALGKGSKINHLSYVGDATLGERVNVGAGTITCNYDGANKHQTVLGDDVFIGSNSSLVAPIEIGTGSTTGAGSTLTNNVGEQTLAVTRAKLRELKGWERPKKK